MLNLILFGTEGCHLCEDAENILAEYKQNLFKIESIDIAVEEQWQKQYAVLIPVLYHPETKKQLGWPFSLVQVQAFIKELSND
ncbi:MAG: glutaredoxin family protein [Methylococcales symbiont of Hymedesmia sp. n. MRB-2018]|nr:MAG: glutaredoxin family protein [Methylococcales symbiont of Hymedesmia sp. n. MRB-2018]KAF3984575.1 MAG: glutaredoxin family protein [Methylococcales symbiont of Hymedesmia sp. n. MRB-2018]